MGLWCRIGSEVRMESEDLGKRLILVWRTRIERIDETQIHVQLSQSPVANIMPITSESVQ